MRRPGPRGARGRGRRTAPRLACKGPPRTFQNALLWAIRVQYCTSRKCGSVIDAHEADSKLTCSQWQALGHIAPLPACASGALILVKPRVPSTDRNFVHLHVHSDYSLLDRGVQDRQAGAEGGRARHDGAGLTDHGNLFGAIDFYTAAKSKGIKPLISFELYLAEGSRLEKQGRRRRGQEHIPPRPPGPGHRRLPEPAQAGQRRPPGGFYYRPRTDLDTLARRAEGPDRVHGMLASLIRST